MWMQWQNGDYRKKQLKKLSYKIHEIYPHIPSPENLIIVGKNTILSPEMLSTSAESLSGEEHKEQYLCEVSKVIEVVRTAFQINGTTLADNDLLSNSSITIRVLFEPEANYQTPFVRYIEFVNKGLTTLRIYWNMFKKFRTFQEIMTAIPKSSPFYFNNGPLLITPGKTVYLPVWFKPKINGNYFEIWQITTVPNFWDEDFKLLVSFESIFYESDVQLETIKQMLETRIRNTLIEELVTDVLNTVKYEDKPKEPCTITLKQAFESVNQEPYGLKMRSKYEYKQDVVDELTTFYENIRTSEDPVVWNYSLKKLKYVAKKRDILDYVDNQISQCKRAAERRTELRDFLESVPKEGRKSFSKYSKYSLSLCIKLFSYTSFISRLQ